ncbi:MAG: hypothetical protein IPO71_12120 [Nitrosomonas sp.]|jgi:hypothetical protein|nr:hypothetical protein [Nitrosomonas sp.]
MAGNGQSLQGSPGHKHPLQPAYASDVDRINPKPQAIIKLVLDTNHLYIFIP